MARIFQAEVILYDEFDGDLLMVAYSDADQKHTYERAAANGPWILESGISDLRQGTELPEDLLKYGYLQKEAERSGRTAATCSRWKNGWNSWGI